MDLRKTLLSALFIVLGAGAHAHDFWLIPDFAVRPGQLMRIAAHTGDRFPAGDTAVTADRIARFEVHTARARSEATNLRVLDKWTEADIPVPAPGTYAVAVEIKPRFIELQAKEFGEYLAHEGLTAILEQRAQAKQEDQPGRELYSKFAKTIVSVGKADDTAMKAIGLRLEIVPLKNPAAARPGEKLPVRVLFDGKPLARAQVAAVAEVFSPNAAGEEDPAYRTVTGYEGVAHIPLLAPGTWLVKLVHMVPAGDGMEHDWESFFSTLTFRIPPEDGFPLTVDSIMRGPDLVGYGIDSIRWSGDGERLYFGWRKPGEKKSHTYVVTRADRTVQRVADAEAKQLPPAGGRYTRDRKKTVFVEDGDIVLQDTVSNERKVLMRTVDPETSPRFTSDESAITFVRDNNLYRISLQGDRIFQLTDFRTGQRPPEPKPTDNQKFLAEQQKELFEVVRERARQRAEAEEERKERDKRKPYYIPRGARISGLELSPDQTLVIFTQFDPAERDKTAVVPNFVTDSGYTEDLTTRIKVGDAQGKSKMGIASVETGEVVWADPGQKDRPAVLSSPEWSEDGRNLVVTGVSADNKDFWIFLVDPQSGKAR
ncbi:MAG: DUF4198 domain-containing protein, partial [Acidobacteria bacterium]|nr:DUF4198 domain-containing protein [Acidobacteriota bacterium]